MELVPMPLVPPCTKNDSPGFRAPRINTLLYEVKKDSQMAAAWIMVVFLGTGSA